MLHAAPTPLAPEPSRLRRALDAAARTWDGRTVLRVEAPAPPVDPLAWLEAQAGGHRAYWRGRGEAEARASLGAALVVDGPLADVAGRAGRVLAALPAGARLTTTARFDAEAQVGAEWAPFGSARFVLPRVEVRSDGRAGAVAVHVAPGESLDAARAAVAGLRWTAPPGSAELGLPFMRRDDPDRAEWGRMLRWALGAFEGGPIQKVVLARRARFLFEDDVDAFALLRRLEAATPRCFHALVEAADAGGGEGGAAFLTATPERLFRLDGRSIETEAVAGTRPRSASDADDDRLRDELMASEKDRREHGYVRDRIAAALAPITASLDADDDASAMTLARGRHLYAGFRGTLADGVGALDVLQALHPTPAVGGTPTDLALDAIDRLEPFDRGLYAGPIGWVGRDGAGREAAEVAVGIRSGLVQGRALSLYSGAGIVAGSDPAAEWAEIEHKIGDFARVLGLTDRAEA